MGFPPTTSNPSRDRDVTHQIRSFCEARDWTKFHTPKNLAMALAAEAGELLALFQWLTPAEADEVTKSDAFDAVKDEMADVATYLLLLSDRLGVDLTSEVIAKLQRNESRYPVDVARGTAAKYTDFHRPRETP